ncbi:hypothetical protein ABKN59_011975 [Abortiporus biennis]
MCLPPLWFSCHPSPFTIFKPSRTKPIVPSSSQSHVFKCLPTRKASFDTGISDEDHTISSTYEDIDDSALREYIQNNFTPMVEYPILDFVRSAWNFTPDMIPTGDYNIPMEYVKGYCLAPLDNNQHGERASCIWLSKILNHLHNALLDNPSNGARFINVRDRVVRGNCGKLEPNLLPGEREDVDDQQHWEEMTAFLEVKHGYKLELPLSQDDFNLKIDLSHLFLNEQTTEIYEEPTSTSMKRKRANTPFTDWTDSSKRRKDEDRSAASTQHSQASAHPSALPMKDQGIVKTTFTDHEVQVLKYANKLQCHGVRNYSTGIFFDNQWISLWYIDSMGIVKSEPFMFPQQAHYLLLVIAAMKAASLPRLSVSPFIDYSLLQAKFGSYEHTFLQLTEADDEEGNAITDPAELCFPIDVQENRQLLNTHGAIGRATTVVPILPPQLSATSNTSAESCEDMGEKYLVTKISWPEEQRKSEDGYIRVIRKKMKKHPDAKHCLKNIAKVKYSLTLKRDAEQLLFPRGLTSFEEQGEPRVFRLLVLGCYEPLQNVNSVEEFMKVFRDVVIAHHWVFSVAKTLHRDISVTNLMVQRIGPTEINGFLTDFDLAVGESKDEQDEEVKKLRGLDSDTTPPSQPPGLVARMEVSAVKEKAQTNKKWQNMRFRTGTVPFMALDILKSTPRTPIHVYRYDLESFFYVLVWFCAGFNPKEHTLASINAWRTPSYSEIAKNKEKFTNAWKETTRGTILADTHSTYQPLLKAWVFPLRSLFQEIELHTSTVTTLIRTITVQKGKLHTLRDNAFLSREEKREQRHTLNRNIEELVLSVTEKRKKLATYENFIAKLKVDIPPASITACQSTETDFADYDKSRTWTWSHFAMTRLWNVYLMILSSKANTNV